MTSPGQDVISSLSGRHAFLSNFSPSPLVVDGIEFPTVEHAYHAAKDDRSEIKLRIAAAASPGEAKRLGGRNGIVALRPDWEDVKGRVMLGLLRQKFEDRRLALLLLDTGDAELIEGNRWGDREWGAVRRGDRWEGGNLLGRLLEAVRTEVRERMRTSRHWLASVEVEFRDRDAFARPTDTRHLTYEMWVGAATEEEAKDFVELSVAGMEDVVSHRITDLIDATSGDPGVVRTWPA